ncbi:hypothetical protein Trydic_g6312 [Trypoxylus dichotomus]
MSSVTCICTEISYYSQSDVQAPRDRVGQVLPQTEEASDSFLLFGGTNVVLRVMGKKRRRCGRKTAAEAHRELHKVYGDPALSETTCRDWFRRFKDDDFDVDDHTRDGRPKTFEDAELEASLDEDPCQTQQQLSSPLEVTR